MNAAMGDQTLENAPIVQLLLTASFAPEIGELSIIDIADIYGLFRDEFPVFRQIVRAGPMSFTPTTSEPEIRLARGLPRVSFSSSDTSHQILFQEDRLSFGWLRIGSLTSTPEYPGFSKILSQFLNYLKVLNEWLINKGIQIEPIVGEVIYTDAFLVTEPTTGKKRKISDIFTYANPTPTYAIYKFDYSWGETLPGDLSGYVEGSASGPSLSPDGTPTLTLETTSSFDLSGDWDCVGSRFESVHQATTEIFKRLVKPEARTRS